MDSARYGSCRSAIGEAEGANEEGFYPESSRSLDSLRQMRLVALLHDMVDDDGKVKAAKTLGVNHRTVSRAVESATLTERMSDALERHLLLGGGSAAAQQRKRVETLEERLVALEEELRGSLEAVVGEIKALREEQARATRHVERRLRRLEAGMNGSEMSSHVSVEPESSKRRYVRPRTYPQLVTQQAEPDENLVYGDATPVIVEWRKARDEYLRTLKTGTVLDRAEAEQPDAPAGDRYHRGARTDAAPGVVLLGLGRPAGSGTAAKAVPGGCPGGAKPGVVAPAKPAGDDRQFLNAGQSSRRKAYGLLRNVVFSPVGHVRCHKRLEELPMVRHAQVEQLMGDNKVLELDILIAQVGCQGDRASGRAGTPLASHVPDSHARRGDVEALRPLLDALPERFVSVVSCRHLCLRPAVSSGFGLQSGPAHCFPPPTTGCTAKSLAVDARRH